MGKNILSEIIDEINIKPNKSKLLLKWVVGISGGLIMGAFIFGQLKMSKLNRLDDIEKNIGEQNVKIEGLHQEFQNGRDETKKRIDKVYDDAIDAFDKYQEYNQKQLELIIDYSGENKELLKEMIYMNSIEREAKTKTEINRAKTEKISHQNAIQLIQPETGDTIFSVNAVNQSFINNINADLYEIQDIKNNKTTPTLFDVTYKNK